MIDLVCEQGMIGCCASFRQSINGIDELMTVPGRNRCDRIQVCGGRIHWERNGTWCVFSVSRSSGVGMWALLLTDFPGTTNGNVEMDLHFHFHV